MSDDASKTPSTLQSYVDSASGAVQSAIGSLTGNTADQAKGEQVKEGAEAEREASKAHVKVPGATVSSDGGVARDHSDRSQGSWNQTVGSAKEAVGGLIGSEVSMALVIISSLLDCILTVFDSLSSRPANNRIAKGSSKRPRVSLTTLPEVWPLVPKARLAEPSLA